MAHGLPYLYFSTHHIFRLTGGFANQSPTLLAPVFPFPLPLSTRVPTVLSYHSTGISTCYPSTTSFDLALGPDLPRADQLYSGNLRYSAEGFSPSSRYSFRHSLFLKIHCSLQYSFFSLRMLLYQSSFDDSTASVVCFSPGHFRRRTSRPVSYYALF